MILVTGLARSGTTLLTECLDHHPHIKRKKLAIPLTTFIAGSKRVSQFIDGTDLRQNIPGYLKEEMLTQIALRDGEYCQEIVEPVRRCQAELYDLLFLEIMKLLFDTYSV